MTRREPIDAEIVAEPPPAAPDPRAPPGSDYDEHGVPSFDYVRDKIESRYTTRSAPPSWPRTRPRARTVEQQEAERAKAAAAKLEEIRKSLGSA